MNVSVSKYLFRSLLVSYVLSGILLLLLSLALYRLKLPEAQVTPAVYAVYVIACLAGGFLAGKGIRSRRFFWGLTNGVLYFLVLLLVSWLHGHGSLAETSRLSVTLACCAAGGMIGGMMS